MANIKFPSGKETGLLQPFADDPPMYSRTGGFSSFDGANSYNVAWGGTSAANIDYQNNHILIHNIRIVNTDDDNDHTTVYFYEDNDNTNASARNATNLMFYITTAGIDSGGNGLYSSTATIDFPIPLCIKGGARVTATRNGPIVNICYSVLNSSDDAVYDNELKYKYLTGTSTTSTSNVDVHPNLGTETTDIEVWGCWAMNTSDSADDYKTIRAKDDDGNIRASFYLQANETGSHQNMPNMTWYPYPNYLKKGMKIANSETEVYATWFYRPLKQRDVDYDQYES